MEAPCEVVNLEAPLETSKEIEVSLEECIENVIHDNVLEADCESPMEECVVNIEVPLEEYLQNKNENGKYHKGK